jgi:membrane-bound lytic murein transglycosylase A
LAASDHEVRLEAVGFADLPGWADDDHAAALPLLDDATKLTVGHATAREFFESRFTPHRVVHAGSGLVTGYYEPRLRGALTPSAIFSVPIYRRPADLENVVDESQRAATGSGFSHMRRVEDGLEPYATRRQIEEGALAGQDLEFVWLADPVDAFFLHVQGSGLIELPDGGTLRVSYDGKNGHPYTSIGRVLIDQGAMDRGTVTMQRLAEYLRADESRARHVLWENHSFVFFKPLTAAANGPVGVRGTTLNPGRSLAVDAAVHALGTPIYVAADTLDIGDGEPFRRLMVAEDVGSAIRGPERGDIFFGSDDVAAALAGTTNHPARFFVLLPRASAT